MVALSVIIPVYNVEKYLSKCIESVLNQSYKNYEIILINDGSTDSSGLICDQYAKKHSSIRVFHKENGGLSDARNFGIIVSKGDFLAFLDSDDYISENSYEPLMDKIYSNDLDICIGNAVKVYPNGEIKLKIKKRNEDDVIYSGVEFMCKSISNKTYSVATVLGIYKKDFIVNNSIYFTKGLLHEDELWTPNVYIYAERVEYVNVDFYYHFQREGSITHRKDKTRNSLDKIKISYMLAEMALKIKNPEMNEIFRNRIVTLYIDAFSEGELYQEKYKVNLDVNFLKENSFGTMNKVKVYLLELNPERFVGLYNHAKKGLRFKKSKLDLK